MKILHIEFCHECKHHGILSQIELPRGMIRATYGCELTGEKLRWDQKEFPRSCRLKDVVG